MIDKELKTKSHETDMDLSHEDFKLLEERMENPQKNEKLKKLFNIPDYDVIKLIDTKYYKKKRTKITSRTYIVIEKEDNNNKKMNNYERIKQMTIDEMIEFIRISDCYTTCNYKCWKDNDYSDNSCNEGIRQWLLSEVSNAPIEEDEYLPF